MKKRSIRNTLSSDLAVEMTEMLEFYLIIFCFGNVVFSIVIIGNENLQSLTFERVSLSYIGALIGVLHAALPM